MTHQVVASLAARAPEGRGLKSLCENFERARL